MKEREVQEAKVCMKNPPNPKPSANTLQGRGERGGSAEDGGPAGGGGRQSQPAAGDRPDLRRPGAWTRSQQTEGALRLASHRIILRGVSYRAHPSHPLVFIF